MIVFVMRTNPVTVLTVMTKPTIVRSTGQYSSSVQRTQPRRVSLINSRTVSLCVSMVRRLIQRRGSVVLLARHITQPVFTISPIQVLSLKDGAGWLVLVLQKMMVVNLYGK
jgi:hypothetical protein